MSEREREREREIYFLRGHFISLHYKWVVKESRPINVTSLHIRSFPVVVIHSVAWTLLIVLEVPLHTNIVATTKHDKRCWFYCIPINIVGIWHRNLLNGNV